MIAIKDMEMPTDCKKCSLMGTDGNPKDLLRPMMCVAIWATTHEIKHCVSGKIRDDCPLVEIEEPEDCVNNYLTFKEALNALKKSFLSDKNSLWFLFGVWIGFVIIAFFKFLILKE